MYQAEQGPHYKQELNSIVARQFRYFLIWVRPVTTWQPAACSAVTRVIGTLSPELTVGVAAQGMSWAGVLEPCWMQFMFWPRPVSTLPCMPLGKEAYEGMLVCLAARVVAWDLATNSF
jgi:hypothetical protein